MLLLLLLVLQQGSQQPPGSLPLALEAAGGAGARARHGGGRWRFASLRPRNKLGAVSRSNPQVFRSWLALGLRGAGCGRLRAHYWEALSPLSGGREAKRAAPARPASLGGTRRPPSAARGRGHRPLVRMVRVESWGGLEQLWAAQGCSEHWGPGATRVVVAAGPWGQRHGAPAVPSASCHQHGALKPACRSSGAGQRRVKQPRGLGCVWLGCQH